MSSGSADTGPHWSAVWAGSGEPLITSGVLASLWRAIAVFRVVGLLFCLYLIVRWRHLYANAPLALAVGATMTVVTVVVVQRALDGRAHRRSFVLADLVITVLLTLVSRLAQQPDQYRGGMPTLTSLWAAGPAIEAGVLLGAAAGATAGAVQLAASMVVRQGYDGRTLVNGVLLLTVGGIVGYLATVAVRAERARIALAAERARLAEHARLSRSIHDGVLQVLGLLHRRGLAEGGSWAELAREAAEQEAALRTLMATEPHAPLPDRVRDLTAELAAFGSHTVVVSVPQDAVPLPAAMAGEIVQAIREALRNVERHAGPGARAWISLEDRGDAVAVGVRDDGVGMPADRPETAVGRGHRGLAASIGTRIADLGGRVTIRSAPGEGTEIDIVVPVVRSL